jgi:hypothetical protein
MIKDDRASFSGLLQCGLIWGCSSCSAAIREVRSQDISRACTEWITAGNSMLAVTFTVPHDRDGPGMSLDELFSLVAESFRQVSRGRPWRRVKENAQVAGQIRAIECTCGEHGWHPHIHALYFLRGPFDIARIFGNAAEFGAEGLALYLAEKWGDVVEAAGYRRPSLAHGVKAEQVVCPKEAGEYIAKTADGTVVGLETARGDLKSGRGVHRTPFQIFDGYLETGSQEDLRLWLEYEAATYGRQCITWSSGLREIIEEETGARLPPELTDDEAAEVAEDQDAETDLPVYREAIAEISARAWQLVTMVYGLPADILDAAERGGADAVIDLLARHGITAGVTRVVPYSPRDALAGILGGRPRYG